MLVSTSVGWSTLTGSVEWYPSYREEAKAQRGLVTNAGTQGPNSNTNSVTPRPVL